MCIYIYIHRYIERDIIRRGRRRKGLKHDAAEVEEQAVHSPLPTGSDIVPGSYYIFIN